MQEKRSEKRWTKTVVLGLVAAGALGWSGLWAQESPQSDAREAKSAKATASESIRYRYDKAGRIVEAEYNEMIIRYRYDAGGNLVARSVEKK